MKKYKLNISWGNLEETRTYMGFLLASRFGLENTKTVFEQE